MHLISNTESLEKSSLKTGRDAKYYNPVEESVAKKLPISTIAKGAVVISWPWERSFQLVESVMTLFTKAKRAGRGAWAIWSTKPPKMKSKIRQKYSSHMKKEREKKAKKVKYDPIPFKLSGAQFELNSGMINGSFHPIDLELWRAIMGFHRQISINLGGESVSYHRWDEESKQYHTIIPFQTTVKHGLSVDVNWEDERNEKLLNQYGEKYKADFFPACTIHTHVNVAAFESGTDAKDEEQNPGWHITLGKLITHSEYDLDFRMRIPQTKKLSIVNTGLKIDLESSHLFAEARKNREIIYKTPGTEDFHHLIQRVEFK
tara:strand:+ start:9473 stop:10423 length:951 start_codon:yes stop_codon:yes gene_type:complete